MTTMGTPTFSPDFGSVIRGGQLSLSVLATIDGQSESLANAQNVIGGTNPSTANVLAYIARTAPPDNAVVIEKIALYENRGRGGLRQFAATANGGQGPIHFSQATGLVASVSCKSRTQHQRTSKSGIGMLMYLLEYNYMNKKSRHPAITLRK